MRQREELEQIGKRILEIARSDLYLSMHFMGRALGSLSFQMDLSTRTVGTDAESIRFHPVYLMQLYADDPKRLNRSYMHMLMHCLFRHMFTAAEHEDTELWDLSADIAVESVIDTMHYPAIEQLVSDFRREWYERLEAEIHVLTAEKIYHYFEGLKRDFYQEEKLRQEFSLCDHSFWQRMQDKESPEMKNPSSGPQDSPDTDNREENQEKNGQADVLPMGRTDPKDEEWKKNAERIHSELETYAKEKSEDTGVLDRMLQVTYRKRRSYKEFLKKFRILREETKVDPESFDYGLYYYGMELYGNMPLLEENEFRESEKVEELVIAIDTSASCQEVLVQKFLNETASILLSRESFFQKVNIHIMECDNRVHRDLKITSVDEMKRYAEGFQISGGYGTDFRPVFARVEELIRQGELKNLKGLLYFTDGFGEYPTRPTPYDTAFVFWKDEELDDVHVPEWAVKVYLDPESAVRTGTPD